MRDLPQGERDDISNALIEKPEVFDLLREVEDDLIDALAGDELPAPQREAAIQFVAATGQQHRLESARLLALKSRPSRKAAGLGGGWPAFAFLAAAASAILAVLLFSSMTAQRELVARLSDMENARRPIASPGAVARLLLPETAVRGATSMVRLQLEPKVDAVFLDLTAPLVQGRQPWRALLRDQTGALILEQAGEIEIFNVAEEQRVEILVPARLLAPGRMQVELLAGQPMERIGVYAFSVERSTNQPAR